MNDIERRTLIGAAGIGAIAALSKAGPLNPPAGSVVPTGKTITEAEPRIALNATNTPGAGLGVFTITQPGSYYLTANIQAAAPQAGIFILASDVTLDLNGFSIIGGAGTGYGIGVSGGIQNNITIRNGTIRNFGLLGVFATNTSFTRIENVTVTGCAATGISAGDNAVVVRCQAGDNGSGAVGGGGTASNGDGISVGLGSIVQRCTSRFSGTHGINARSGYAVIADCFVSDANRAGSAGINAAQLALVRNCQVGSCTIGIRAGTGSGNRVEGCNVESCAQVGIQVEGNTCQVVGNHVAFVGSAAGHAGIKLSSGVAGSVVENNRLVTNFRHIDVLSATNLIMRNTMSYTQGGTGVWSIAAGNSIGPLVNVGGVDHATVAASSHPQANLSW